MSTPLKPCPFCGGQAVLCFNVERPSMPMYWFLCRDCHAGPPECPTEGEAKALWNKRHILTYSHPIEVEREICAQIAESTVGDRGGIPERIRIAAKIRGIGDHL